MKFQEKSNIMDKEAMDRTILRMAHEILEKNKGVEDLAIIGIKTRGAYLADRIVSTIERLENKTVPMGALDITLYRDDLSEISYKPVVQKTQLDFHITGKNIVLVDDVLYTGRTIRCALDELVDFGRPKSIQLAVLIDRGHRELPIKADYVGKNVPTSAKENIQVKLREIDRIDEVIVEEPE
ncbi:MAG: bifunctional pyr operon transcriptional regulator/uracil phosphoribosyltransferase PyrR [Candidatus Omnitrophica bacterium]|nr:bifunctional pyr operon transcriptional regulator/uracil phosphoribosyltransferase PyrR [Candidatus Omnitrophota bacterium]